MHIPIFNIWTYLSSFGGDAEGRGGLYFLIFLLPLFTVAQTNYQQAETYFKQENFSKAKPIFENHLKQHPNDLKTREYLGDIAGYSEEWDKSISYYKALVEEEPSNANYHFKYGGAMGMKAMSISKIRALTYISDIKSELEQAAKLDPKHIEARWALIEFYIQLPGIFGGSENKAIAYAKELGTISSVDGYLASGYIAEYTNRPKDAERYYKKAIEVGGSPHTYEKLSSLYEKNKQPKEALATTSESLQKHKRNQLNYQIGKIAAQYNLEPEYGIECLSEYLANYSIKDGVPKDWAYFRLAQIYKNLGQKEIALTWINKALLDRADFKEAQKEKSLILAM
ncbi:tetratricopeptide repeat protein [Aequorivita marina]|uniref:tetratricopeptide repeat protein n=1 Tax=Aequorivita marina TaxID=3073654 RepID=UPI00287651AE|nr:tetratricopeptide repeat protein [Aequorivita sp. S2608]MDS1298450.1 tetratricopeptide repeat protein [Aequorivita sp. S2608]